MAERSPTHKLTASYRKGELAGWTKRINGEPRWIVSATEAPDGPTADRVYEQRFPELWQSPAAAGDAPADLASSTVSDLCDLLLTRLEKRVGAQSNGMSQGAWDEYQEAFQAFCEQPAAAGGTVGETAYQDLVPDDFGTFHAALGKAFGVHRQKKFIILVRSLFKFLAAAPCRLPAMDYGGQFPLPRRRDMRLAKKRHNETHGPKLFEPLDVRRQLEGRTHTIEERLTLIRRRLAAEGTRCRGLSWELPPKIAGAGPALRAMVLAGVNAGFGNTDLGELTLPVVRRALKGGWIEYDRPKTGASRLAWLWPETRAAWHAYLACRPAPALPEHSEIFLLTREGLPYVTEEKDQVSIQFGKLLERLGQLRLGRNFYSLRRTYRSCAAEVGKELAIDLTMGHADEESDMAKLYTVGELRGELKKISEHVRHRILLEPIITDGTEEGSIA